MQADHLRTLFVGPLRSLLTLLGLVSILGGCQCEGKSRRSGSAPQVAGPGPAPSPAPVSPPAAGTPDPSVGEAVPPITPDKVVVLETGDKAGLRHLILETTDKAEYGRQLSEYFLVVRSSKASCVRIKVRPTSGVIDKVGDDIARSGEQGSGACSGQKVASEGSATSAPAPAPSPTPPPTLALTGDSARRYEFIHQEERPTFQLLAPTPSLCSARIFRMETAGSQTGSGLEKFVTKTGRLLVVGQKVRIWLDDEVANVCTGGGSLDSRAGVPFGPLVQDKVVPQSWRDKLWLDQLRTLSTEMDEMVTKMAVTIGSPSDVDKSGFVEIFVSPEVNRTKLLHHANIGIDNFRAGLIFKPGDLAYYNAESNPTSNEGEILYLWSPDPAGLFEDRTFPSANSITSNYAKGYLAAQLMELLYLNEKILKQKQSSVADPWLVQSLALLASIYYAGIDYSSFSLSQYLTSRPQYISLSGELNKEMFSADYLPMASDEQLGLRGLFGWYLHMKICGEGTVAPCEGLRKLLSSANTGGKLVEEMTSLPYDTAVKNFALSLAIGLADKPGAVYTMWDGSPVGYPPRPVVFADLREIFASDPPLTEEESNTGVLLSSLNPTTSKVDRTVAGPYPSRHMLFAQPLGPDFDLEFKLVPDAIAVLQVVGLVSNVTDVAAVLGEGLSVVFVPIGERDKALRNIHYEKVSERAPGDVRPVNLANTVDPMRTFSQPPFYESEAPLGSPNLFTVTKARELWSFGSLDNFLINVEGAKTLTSDSDALNIEFQPCLGLSGPSLATCQSASHKALVQLVLRDSDKELAPMLLVTSTDRKIFRGHSILGQVKNLDSDFTEVPSVVSALCQAAHTVNSTLSPKTVMTVTFDATDPTNPVVSTGAVAHDLLNGDIVYFTASDGKSPPGISPYFGYTVSVVDSSTFKVKSNTLDVLFSAPVGAGVHQLHKVKANAFCANGGVAGESVFSDLTSRLPTPGYNHNYANFLMQGILGFPYTTRRTVTWDDVPECLGPYCYQKYEWQRQFFKFALDKDKKPNVYAYHPATVAYDTSPPLTVLDEATILGLAALKRRIDSPTCSDDGTDPSFAANLTACTSVAELTEEMCKSVCARTGNHVAVDTAVRTYLQVNGAFGLCRSGPRCAALSSLMAMGYPPVLGGSSGNHTGVWLAPTRFAMYDAPGPNTGLSTYFSAIQPEQGDDYCTGFPSAGGTVLSQCVLKSDAISDISDLREQFHAPAGRITSACFGQTLETDVDVCIDPLSYMREMEPTDPYVFAWYGLDLPTDRVRVRRASITQRAGEIVAKPERIHAVVVDVPGTGTIANVIVGARKESQGKYILRARLLDLK